jgi:hypothetical protein
LSIRFSSKLLISIFSEDFNLDLDFIRIISLQVQFVFMQTEAKVVYIWIVRMNYSKSSLNAYIMKEERGGQTRWTCVTEEGKCKVFRLGYKGEDEIQLDYRRKFKNLIEVKVEGGQILYQLRSVRTDRPRPLIIKTDSGKEVYNSEGCDNSLEYTWLSEEQQKRRQVEKVRRHRRKIMGRAKSLRSNQESSLDRWLKQPKRSSAGTNHRRPPTVSCQTPHSEFRYKEREHEF